MSVKDRLYEKFSKVIKEIGEETGTAEDTLREKLKEIEDFINQSDKERIDSYLNALRSEMGEQDSMVALRRKMWRTYLDAKQVSIAVTISIEIPPNINTKIFRFENSIVHKSNIRIHNNEYIFTEKIDILILHQSS